jgi:hypothetical protein
VPEKAAGDIAGDARFDPSGGRRVTQHMRASSESGRAGRPVKHFLAFW